MANIKILKNKAINYIKHNKKSMAFFSVFAMLFIFTFINITSPTSINRLFASMAIPANNNFKSNSLYQKVIDAYNLEHSTTHPYTYSLSDEELADIHTLNASYYSVEYADGIEKLTSLESIDLTGNTIKTLDLSNNTSLKTIKLSGNMISSLKLPNAVEVLDVSDNFLTILNLSNINSLQTLNASNNHIENIQLSENAPINIINLENNVLDSFIRTNSVDLTELNLNKNPIETLNVQGNTNLKKLYLNRANLNNINVSTNTNLEELELIANDLTSINLENNTMLKSLKINNNLLTVLDISNNQALTSLEAKDNNLTDVVGEENLVNIKTINLSNNELTSLDYSAFTHISYLILFNNFLSGELDLTHFDKIITLNINNNNFTSLKYNQRVWYERMFGYNVQRGTNTTSRVQYSNVRHLETVYQGISRIFHPIDSYEMNLAKYVVIPNESITVNQFLENMGVQGMDDDSKIFVYDTENNVIEGDDLVPHNGKFVWNTYATNGNVNSTSTTQIYKCSNPVFKDLNLYKRVVESYNSENSANYSMCDILSDEQLASIKTLNASSMSIYYADGIEKLTGLTYLSLSGNFIRDIDLSHNTNLEELYLSNNYLRDLDVTHNIKLRKLDLGYSWTSSEYDTDLDNNKLRSINISNNNKLTYLGLESNNFRNINLPNYKLSEIYLGGNLLRNVNLLNQTGTKVIDLSANKISNVAIPNTELSLSFHAAYNYLKELDFSSSDNLYYFAVENNHIGSVISNHNEYLSSCHFSNNNIKKIDVDDTACRSISYDRNPLELKDQYYIVGDNRYHSFIPPLDYLGISIEDENIVSYSYGNIIARSFGTTTYHSTALNSTAKITVYDISSDKYLIQKDNKMIFTETDHDAASIMPHITVHGLDGRVNGKYFEILDNEEVVDKFELVYIYSDVYDFNLETSNEYGNEYYIYTGTKNFDMSKVTCVGGVLKDEGTRITLYYYGKKTSYGDGSLRYWRISTVKSNKYDLSNNYIYTGIKDFKISNVSITYGRVDLEDGKLKAFVGDRMHGTWSLASISSDAYNLSNDYIYVKNKMFDVRKISCSNVDCIYSNNKLIVSKNNEELDSRLITSITSSKYDLNNTKFKVPYGGNDLYDNIIVINGTKELQNNKIIIKYEDDILDEFTTYSRLKGDANNDDTISISDISKIYKYIKGKTTNFTQEDILVSDVNNDNNITLTDISKIYKYLHDKIHTLD